MRTPRASTADELLRMAERLFAEEVAYGPSLRQIGAAAGSANKNAVQYHFGDREGLIRAIFAWRLPELDRRRAEMLAETGADMTPPTLRQLLEILFRPIIECRDGDGKRTFAGFLRKHFVHRSDPDLGASRLAPVTSYIVMLIQAALPALSRDLLMQRLQTCTSLFLDVFASVDNGTSIFTGEEALEEALTLCVAILRAPDPRAAGV